MVSFMHSAYVFAQGYLFDVMYRHEKGGISRGPLSPPTFFACSCVGWLAHRHVKLRCLGFWCRKRRNGRMHAWFLRGVTREESIINRLVVGVDSVLVYRRFAVQIV